MFRYIALAWDDATPAISSLARRLGLEVRSRADWELALDDEGLQVFVTGTKDRVNGAYLLRPAGGVIVGKLFRKCDVAAAPASDVVLSESEVQHIRLSSHALIDTFWGRYIAFIRSASGSAHVLRDPSGTLPCFLIRHHGVSIVFSLLEDALALPSLADAPRVNWDGVAAHILVGELGARETCLEGVSPILPGEQVGLGDRRATLVWNAVDIARAPLASSAAEAVSLLHEAVTGCTRAWASLYDTVLLRLSGGVDSSVMLSCLAPNATPADVVCLNYHSKGSDSDERQYARMAAARAGRDLIERERDPAFRLETILGMSRTPGPTSHIGYLNARVDARMAAAHEASALFTGAGGDQLFYEFNRWWPLADYLRHRGVDRGFAQAALDAARLGRVSVWRAVAMAFADQVRPNPTMLAPVRERPVLGEAIRSWAVQRERFIHPALCRGTRLPIGKHMQTWALMYPIGYYDPFERDRAPELVNPLLSQPLIELCLRLPTYVLTQGGRGRASLRRAFSAHVPGSIINRRSKGGMEEHIKDVLDRNISFVRELLIDGQLARRGFIDREVVISLLSDKPTAVAGSMSEIHSLIAVEAWLGRWIGTQRRAPA